MKPPRVIQYKALFLLATFSMNTVVGFACSLGVDMGFNSKHHSHNSSNKHSHSDAGHHDEHDGNNSHSHYHGTASHHHSDNDNNTVSLTSQSEENCCKDFVAGFNSLDKQLAKQNNNQPKITYLSLFVMSALMFDANNAKGYVQHLRIPPREIDFSPPDIRVFIQSFLI